MSLVTTLIFITGCLLQVLELYLATLDRDDSALVEIQVFKPGLHPEVVLV
jgi:hypothetical protein